ncbi:uncharacterized protein LOC109821903, partial [Asparagus officinalis]|uniref:uncharacterized protein LOC109821903 n=1 Tax=Asparagus officinalis TaxID=4686 RepID=UPI00098E608F
MAVDCGYEKARKRSKMKLLVGEHVEVRYSDEGLKGSWHSGTVIGLEKHTRLVEYRNLVGEDNYSRLKEQIHVSDAIEGLTVTTQKNYRGHIRRLPPPREIQKSEIKYGLCVDALVNDAWWEGVVIDHAEDSKECLIFFPDQGDQQIVNIDNLRLTQEWNEVSGHWRPRGEWVFLQVLQSFNEDEELPVSVRQIWFDLRATDAFSEKIGVWIFGSQSIWHMLVSELIQELRTVVLGGSFYKQLVDISKSKLSDEFSAQKYKNDHCGSKVSILAVEENCDFIVEASRIYENNFGRKNSSTAEPWKPINLEAAYYPEAVMICVNEERINGKKVYCKVSNVVEKARKHLLALGWKIETRQTETIVRVRYISPEGKCYHSLRKACCSLLQGHPKWEEKQGNDERTDKSYVKSNISNIVHENFHHLLKSSKHQEDSILDPKSNRITTEKSQSLSKMIDSGVIEEISSSIFEEHFGLENASLLDDNLEPGSFPRAVFDYKKYCDLSRGKGKHIASCELNVIRLNARRHLKFMGWKFWIKIQERNALFITSPTGKPFRSLYSACVEYLREENLKRGTNRLRNYSKFSESTEIVAERNRRSKRRKMVSQIDTQSKKRPQQINVQTSSQRAARTVLSLLIENGMVNLRDKVSYIHKSNGQVLMEGHITSDGIKCKCCKMVYNPSNFEVHAGSKYHRPYASIFLQNGTSLLECQKKMVQEKKPKYLNRQRMKVDCCQYKSDTVCSICHDGGDLILCDHCPSSFHLGCVSLESVPGGKWFCPSCRCGICGMSEFNSATEQFSEKTILYCDQCELEYHVGCIRKRGDDSLRDYPVGNWFCSKKCSKIFLHLRQLLGKSQPTAIEGLSWTILRSSRENGVDNLQFDAEKIIEHDSKLCVALKVLHECFLSIKEPRTGSDFMEDLLCNRESELRRLNFYGFYTMLLEKEDELVSVATFRVFGDKVAEMPLIGTRVKYRHQGMCRLLVNELEKLLSGLGVQSLVLPAVPQLLRTWTSSFGFNKMSDSNRLNLSEYTILCFQDTTMCQKLLRRDPTIATKPEGHRNELTGLARSSMEMDSDINHFNQNNGQIEAEKFFSSYLYKPGI